MQKTLDQLITWVGNYPWITPTAGVVLLIFVAIIADRITKRVLLRTLQRLTAKTEFTWDDELQDHKVFTRVAQIAPAAVVYFGAPLVPSIPTRLADVVQNVAFGFSVFMMVLAAGATLSAANAIYEKYPISRERPIKGFIQVFKIVVYVLGTILVLAAVMERSPLLFLSGFGALTAVLMLVFKDTILSLVASIQITSTEMLRVGDWVEMPQYGANGDIIDIALHTVKVQNWDKTVSTIPTHKFISDAFKNWRFMSESGGRRIKRSIDIDLSTVRFLSEDDIVKFKQFKLLENYINDKQRELREYNQQIKGGTNTDQGEQNPEDINARRLTNIGTFRRYVLQVLKTNEHINHNMTLMVRQLEPSPRGLPIELYAFTSDTAWATYENVQADIFDHLLAILPHFGLRVFQEPSGQDMSNLAKREFRAVD